MIWLAFILITLNLFIPRLAIAMDLEDVPLPIRQSVVLLSGEGGCATGFIVKDQIVTNAHVTEALCPYGTCYPITVQIMDSSETVSWKYLHSQDAVIAQEVPSLDLAYVENTEHPQRLDFPN